MALFGFLLAHRNVVEQISEAPSKMNGVVKSGENFDRMN